MQLDADCVEGAIFQVVFRMLWGGLYRESLSVDSELHQRGRLYTLRPEQQMVGMVVLDSSVININL